VSQVGKREVRLERPTFTVVGSHGECIVDVESGRVRQVHDEHGTADSGEYERILRFDVGEWSAAYPSGRLAGSRVDILDLGYALKNGAYEPPVAEWRAEHRNTSIGKI